MVTPSHPTAPQIVLATMAHLTVNFKNATVTSARLTPTDTSIHLMALHMITKEPVNTCWSHHVTIMILQ